MLQFITNLNVRDNIAFLIEQWSDGNTPVFRFLLAEILDVIQETLVNPLQGVVGAASLANGSGIWLDYVGTRLDFLRPIVTVTSNLYWGFSAEDLGFDQAGFATAEDTLSDRQPVGDDLYLPALALRAYQLMANNGENSSGSLAFMDQMIEYIFPGKTFRYQDNHDMTLTLDLLGELDDVPELYFVLQNSDAWPSPPGVQLIIQNTTP